MVEAVKTRMTVQVYLAMPETNQIVQLIDGERIVNPPLDKHQKTLGKAHLYLGIRLTTGQVRIAPTGLYLEETHYYEPDIFWVSPANTNCFLRPEGHYWEGAPDFIIEVFSPGTAHHDKKTKFEIYQKHGVGEYWMIDPSEEYIEVWRLNDGRFAFVGTFAPGETFTSPLLPNLAIDVAAFF